jgi:hypothetical protein
LAIGHASSGAFKPSDIARSWLTAEAANRSFHLSLALRPVGTISGSVVPSGSRSISSWFESKFSLSVFICRMNFRSPAGFRMLQTKEKKANWHTLSSSRARRYQSLFPLGEHPVPLRHDDQN